MSINGRKLVIATLLNAGVHYLLARHFHWLPAPPDLLVHFLVFVNIFLPGVAGIILAFLYGIFQDFLYRVPAGGHAIAYLVVAYAFNLLLGRRQRRPGIGGLFLAGIAASFFSCLVYRAVQSPAWEEIACGKVFLYAFYNGLFGLPAYFIYRKSMRAGIMGPRSYI